MSDITPPFKVETIFAKVPWLTKIRKFLTIERVLLAGLVICLLMLNRCNGIRYANQIADSQTKIDSLTLANQTLDSIKNANGKTILLQTAIVTSSQQAIKDLTDSIFDLKRKNEKKIKEVLAYHRNVTKTGVKNVKLPYLDTLEMKRFSDSLEKNCAEVIEFYRDSSVQVPKMVKDSTANFQFEAVVEKDSFHIKSIEFPDTLSIRFVETKGGLFKRDLSTVPGKKGKLHFWRKRSVEVQAFHSNPFVSTTSMTSVFYKAKPNSRLVERLALLGAGVFLGLKLLR